MIKTAQSVQKHAQREEYRNFPLVEMIRGVSIHLTSSKTLFSYDKEKHPGPVESRMVFPCPLLDDSLILFYIWGV